MPDFTPEELKAIRVLVRLFEAAEAALAMALLQTVRSPRKKTREPRRILQDLLDLLNSSGSPVDAVIVAGYRAGNDAVVRMIEGRGARTDASTVNPQAARRAGRLRDEVADSFEKAIRSMERNMRDRLNEVIEEEVASGEKKGLSRRRIFNNIEDRLRNEGMTAFKDAAGRRWSLARYAAMKGNTAAREANTLGTLERLVDNGFDLVQVSRHDHPHDICSKYEGEVFSISGDHPSYPRLEEAPPFHPHCRHRVLPWIEGLN